MPWSTYDAVVLVAGADMAESVAVRGGASVLGPPTIAEWWDARIVEAAAIARAMLRANRYAPPDDPAELSTDDAIILTQAIAEVAWLNNRPFEMRQSGGTKYPLPEIGITLRQILEGLTKLEMATETRLAFVPWPAPAPPTVADVLDLIEIM